MTIIEHYGLRKFALASGVAVAASLVMWLIVTKHDERIAVNVSESSEAPVVTAPGTADPAETADVPDKVEAKDFASFTNWLKEWENGHADLQQGLDLARQQKHWMQRAIKEDPELAYQHALGQDTWSKLPDELKKEVAHRFSGAGSYEVTRDCETDQVWHQLTMEAFSTGNAIIAPKLADRESFEGVMKGVILDTLSAVVAMEGDMAPVDQPQSAPAPEEPPPVTGNYTALWLNIKFSDEASGPTGSAMSTAATAFNNYSYGQLTIVYDVVSVSIAATKASSPSDVTIRTQAKAAALALGYNSANYATVLYRQSLYGQYASLYTSPGYVMLSKSVTGTTVHEIAHTMGVHHANLWKTKPGQPAWGAGVNTLYGEVWDAMAYSNPRDDFNVPEKVQLGWLAMNTDYVHDVANGVYRIYDYRNNTRNFSTVGVNGAYYGVSVFKDTNATNGEYGDRRYMLSYRDRTNVGTVQMTEGLYLHWPRWTYDGSSGYYANAPHGSDIIDTHPAANNVNDAPLSIGETYIDNDPGNQDGDIYITVLSKTDPDGTPQTGDEYVDVKVVVGDQTGNSPPVGGTISSDKSTVGPGEAVAMSVSGVSDPNGDTLAYLWDFGLGTTIAALQSMPLNGSPNQSFVYQSEGTYTVKVTISDCRGGTTQLTKIITVINTPPVANAGNAQTVTLGTASAPWNPADISIIAWYDASDAALVAGAVSRWNDKSGNGRNVLQTTAAKKPTFSATGWDGTRPALTFDGGDALTSAAISNVGAGERTVFMVYDSVVTPTLANQYLLDMKGATEQYYYAVSGSVPKLLYKGSATSTAITTDVSGKHVVAFGNDARTQIYKDGTIGVDDAVNQIAGNTITSINVGSRSGSEYFQGSIAEVIVVPFTMTDSERQVVEGYLANKWGLTNNLPVNHPYKATAPGAQRATVNLSGSVFDVNSGQPLSYKWSPVSGPAPFTIKNSLALSTNAIFTAPGTYTLRLTADDSYDQSFNDVVVTVNPPPPYAVWVGGPFANSFIDTGVNSDPDGDGLSNLIEFAFGTDPTLGDRGSLRADGSVNGFPVPISSDGGATFELLFIRRIDHDASGGLNYMPQFSSDLGTFYDNAVTPIFVAGSAVDANYEVVKVPYPLVLPNGKKALFARVMVTEVP